MGQDISQLIIDGSTFSFELRRCFYSWLKQQSKLAREYLGCPRRWRSREERGLWSPSLQVVVPFVIEGTSAPRSSSPVTYP